VGTTKCSEQNHNPKEKGFKLKEYSHKGFKLKEYSRLKSHESLSEWIPKQAITFVLALRPIGAVAWESPSQLVTIGYELRLIRDTRERYRSPTSLKIFSSWGATRHDRASSAAVEQPHVFL
jgi:hypothetical protein